MSKSNEMSPEAIALSREYKREWRKKNPEKVRKYNVEYWERKAAKLQENAAKSDVNGDRS